jgi:hypothetical protein
MCLRDIQLAAADDETAAEFLEDRRVGGGVGLVTLVVIHIDAPDPVTLRHFDPPSSFSLV